LEGDGVLEGGGVQGVAHAPEQPPHALRARAHRRPRAGDGARGAVALLQADAEGVQRRAGHDAGHAPHSPCGAWVSDWGGWAAGFCLPTRESAATLTTAESRDQQAAAAAAAPAAARLALACYEVAPRLAAPSAPALRVCGKHQLELALHQKSTNLSAPPKSSPPEAQIGSEDGSLRDKGGPAQFGAAPALVAAVSECRRCAAVSRAAAAVSLAN
jgi:hypothetical protein